MLVKVYKKCKLINMFNNFLKIFLKIGLKFLDNKKGYNDILWV